MKASTLAFATAVAGTLAIATGAIAQTGPAETPTFKNEKCYGISKAGKNDCQTASSSCAGTSKKDGQADAWIYVPAGTCEKVVGGSMGPKKG